MARTYRDSVSMTALCAALLFSGPALSQDADVDDNFDRIVVTSQKVEQNLQDVPVAVSVLDSSTIENSFSANIESLQTLVPSVSFRKGSTNKNSALTIRGIGTISFSGAIEPSVSTVVDGVVLSRSGQAFSELYDIERIEVLRGPQGTLFGKNASAGVINIITKRPSSELEGYASASLFEDNEYRVKGRISGPISDTVSASLTVSKSQFDGHIRNVFTNEDVNGYDRWGIRSQVLFQPSDDFDILVSYEHTEAEDDCCADLEVLPSGRNPDSPAAPNSRGIVNGVADLDLDQRQVDHDLTTETIDEQDAVSVEVNKDIWDHTVTSITAYRRWENTEIREGDFTSIGGTFDEPVFGVPFLLHDDGSLQTEQLSQELRIASSQDQALRYLAGFYYLSIERTANFTRNASCQNNGGQNQPILDANPGLTCNSNDIVSATSYNIVETDNFAIFANAEYDIFDTALTAIFGLRYTRDEIDFRHTRRNNDEFGRQGVGVRPAEPNSQFSEASGGFNNTFTGSVENNDVSIRAGLRSDLASVFGSDRNLGSAYFTYSQGYKGPGFNVFFNMGNNDALPIEEEVSDSYEVGYKFNSGNLLFNIAFYNQDIENFQANNFDNSTGVTITRLTNAGDVRTRGFEIDVLWTPVDNLNLSAALAYNDATIQEFNCPVDPTTGSPPANCTDRSGIDLLFSPDLNFTFGVNYRVELDEDWDVVVNGTYARIDDQESLLPSTSGALNPVGLLPGYDMLDATLTVEFQGSYRLTLIGKNLLDESFVTTHSGDNFRYQIPREADRYFGVNFTMDFN